MGIGLFYTFRQFILMYGLLVKNFYIPFENLAANVSTKTRFYRTLLRDKKNSRFLLIVTKLPNRERFSWLNADLKKCCARHFGFQNLDVENQENVAFYSKNLQ